MMDTNEIKWLFFDVGGTLVDEKEAFRRRIRETIAIQKACFHAKVPLLL